MTCSTVLLLLPLASILVGAYGRLLDASPPSLSEDIQLTDILINLQARVLALEQTVKDLTQKVNRQDAELAEGSRLKRTSRFRRQKNIILGTSYFDEVGFHTSFSQNSVPINYKDTIRFDRAITNLGGGYNTTSGQFLCPRSGTYLFNLNILSSRSSDIEAAIINVNNNEESVLQTISYNSDTGTYRQGAGSAILKLTAGDVILVRKIAKLGQHKLLGKYSYFSGYLLHPS